MEKEFNKNDFLWLLCLFEVVFIEFLFQIQTVMYDRYIPKQILIFMLLHNVI